MTREPISINEIRRLTTFIRDRFGVDYQNYAMSSFNRRISYVMDRNRIRDFNVLFQRMEEEEGFFQQFARDLTVNTTEMFRDPEMWVYLREEILPKLIHRKTVRIWHAACSSGEEVYSMAILLKEMGIAHRCKLFASDINEEVIQKAKLGLYSDKRMQVNAENYQKIEGKKQLYDYCIPTSKEGYHRMDPALLQDVNFFRLDLTTGEPFSRFDLVLCRNVMIYFNKDLQNQVLELMLGSLGMGSFLVLGAKETLRWSSVANKFQEISREEKVFKRIKE